MTPHPCRCETCSHLKKHEIHNLYCELSGRKTPHGTLFIERVAELGCLSHPQAREYLMREVVEELERKADKLKDEAYEHQDYMRSARAVGIEIAIALIKGGERR